MHIIFHQILIVAQPWKKIVGPLLHSSNVDNILFEVRPMRSYSVFHARLILETRSDHNLTKRNSREEELDQRRLASAEGGSVPRSLKKYKFLPPKFSSSSSYAHLQHG